MNKHPVLCAVILVLTAGVAMASSVIGLSIEDQARLSKMVVAGRVLSQQGVQNPANGIETAVQLSVTEVFRGDVKPGDTVVFHTRGGRVGKEVSEAVGDATFKSGEEVVVFIEDVQGRLYNLGLSMGVWSLRTDSGGKTLATRAVQDGLEVIGDVQVEYGPISLTELSERIDRVRREPRFEHPVLREPQERR